MDKKYVLTSVVVPDVSNDELEDQLVEHMIKLVARVAMERLNNGTERSTK